MERLKEVIKQTGKSWRGWSRTLKEQQHLLKDEDRRAGSSPGIT